MIRKLPCEECLLLPICMNKKCINCDILLEVLNQFINEPYSNSTWSNMSKLIKKTLRGNWCVVSSYGFDKIASIKKYNLMEEFKGGETHELFHII